MDYYFEAHETEYLEELEILATYAYIKALEELEEACEIF